MEYSYELKIPKGRVGALIGVKAAVKRQIEDATHTRLEIDSKEGDVRIIGQDGLGMLTAQEVVKAIGRGFNPDIAMRLVKQDAALEIIPLQEFIGKSKSKMLRLKGRIIGQDGSTRRTIEDLTGTNICVYGKTVSIIGEIENVQAARRALEWLLGGAPHASVYRWLEKKGTELRRRKQETHLVEKAVSHGLHDADDSNMPGEEQDEKTDDASAKNI